MIDKLDFYIYQEDFIDDSFYQYFESEDRYFLSGRYKNFKLTMKKEGFNPLKVVGSPAKLKNNSNYQLLNFQQNKEVITEMLSDLSFYGRKIKILRIDIAAKINTDRKINLDFINHTKLKERHQLGNNMLVLTNKKNNPSLAIYTDGYKEGKLNKNIWQDPTSYKVEARYKTSVNKFIPITTLESMFEKPIWEGAKQAAKNVFNNILYNSNNQEIMIKQAKNISELKTLNTLRYIASLSESEWELFKFNDCKLLSFRLIQKLERDRNNFKKQCMKVDDFNFLGTLNSDLDRY